MAQRPIRFVHRGDIVNVEGPAPTTTVLAWLREHQRCTGTKEGCNEGDCGACTVIVGELDSAGALRLQPINSCIQFLPTLDGKALITVEDLQGRHPAQQAMGACHGSQCGFCTPGFVMSLFALYLNEPNAGRREVVDALSGNLCRCTGYRPILAAARSEPWFKHIGDGLPNQAFWRPNGLFDPIPPLQAFRKPVLAMFGALDTNNDAARNAELMEAAWKVAGNPRGKAVVFERANHGLFETDHRIPLERELPSLTRFVPGYIDLLTRWLEEVAQGSSGGQ